MKVIEKSQTVITNDIIVIEDELLNIVWFIDIERINGKLGRVKESVNFQYFMEQGWEYINNVYAMAVNAILIKE